MSLETRHTEKQMLTNLLRALRDDPELSRSTAFTNVIVSLKAVMEAEDVAVVEKMLEELR